jgi:hypothetical protein
MTNKSEEIKEFIRVKVFAHRLLEPKFSKDLGRPKESIMFHKWAIANKFMVNERTVRRCFSELRREGIILLPLSQNSSWNSGDYVLYMEGVNDELLEEYLKVRVASVATEYFNDIVKLTKQVNFNKTAQKIDPFKLFVDAVESLKQ